MLPLLLVLLLVPQLVVAGDLLCGTADDDTIVGHGFRTYSPTVDTSGTLPTDCYSVPQAQIPSQRTLVTSPTFDPRKYRVDTTNKIAVIKAQGTIDQINAADAAKQQ